MRSNMISSRTIIRVEAVILLLLLLYYFVGNCGSIYMTSGKPVEEKKIAITFDDGPHPVYTPKLLDGLKKRGIVATFFVTGENAEQYPDIIRKMSEDGHLIGNHSPALPYFCGRVLLHFYN